MLLLHKLQAIGEEWGILPVGLDRNEIEKASDYIEHNRIG